VRVFPTGISLVRFHKRFDVLATALYHGMTVAEVEDLDLSYTPPLGSPYDAV
jgi:hypothetical protein